MKKFKQIGVLFLAVLMLTSVMPVSAMAEEESENITLYEKLLDSGELQKIDTDYSSVNSSRELYVTDYFSSEIDNNNVLEELNLSSNDIESFCSVDYSYNSDIAYEAEFDNGAVVSYDEDMEIVAYSNFDRTSVATLSDSEDNETVIETLKDEYNIDDSYVLKINDNDNGDTVYYWEKEDDEGYINIYDSLSVRVDGTTNKIVTFNRFDDASETVEIVVSENEAKSIALGLKENFNVVTSCEKEYVKPNFFWNKDDIAYNNADIVRLVYNVTIDDIYKVYVDAETGEIIGGDMMKAANNCGTYAYNGFSYASASRDLAKTYLAKLGYTSSSTSVSSSATTLRNKVLDFVTNDSKAYGFYIDSHGTTSTLETDDGIILRSSEVKGNWHFVFLDACSTAANTTWSNAFKISSSYSKRAFLGWSTTVYVDPAYEFCKSFWPETTAQKHSNNIRDAAVWAASQVEGAGTTPIRFYGDKSYNGKSY